MSDQEWDCDKCRFNTDIIPIWDRDFPYGDPCRGDNLFSCFVPQDEFEKEYERWRLKLKIRTEQNQIETAKKIIEICKKTYFEEWGEELRPKKKNTMYW